MHAPNFLFLAITWLVVAVAAAPREAYDGPKTFDELKTSLKELGIPKAESIPEPREVKKQLKEKAAEPSKSCSATVGTRGPSNGGPPCPSLT